MNDGIGRMRLIGAVFVLLSAAIVYQMIRIQNSEHSRQLVELFAKTYNQQVRIILPERGNIYDRWGNLLAGNKEVYEVGIAPPQVVNPETVARDLAAVLEVDYYDTLRKAESYQKEANERYELIKDFVPADKIRQLEQKLAEYEKAEKTKKGNPPSLAGVYWKPHLIRSYPENELAANVLGFYNFLDRWNGRGMLGLEEQYNNLLAGNKQQIVLPLNPTEIQEIPEIPPGASLITSIDRDIQAAMERIIDQAVEANGAESGTLVVMDPKSGEILAMATTPHFNPNEYWRYDEIFPVGSYYNRAISQLYEPGSVFKVLTMAAAIDAGVVQPETPFVDVGAIEVGGIWIYNWDRGAWGPQDMVGCMQHSLNVCLAWVAQELGPSQFYKYLQDFGIGRYTGIDLAGEQVYPLSLPGDSNWYPVNLGTNSFGQGVATTPIQMITAIAAMANEGKMMAPHVVKAYVQDGIQYPVNPRVIRQVVKPETARTITEMLAVSLENEASNALVEGYRVAGKTGTAEIPGPGGYTDMTNASFVGWGPVDDPRFIVYVWLEKPTSSPWGSVVAAPVFSQAVEELVVLMKIPPDEVRQQLASP
ncbi:MAG: penicillin-binding protein 2 [Chloroflexota bacterium]|nr:MAG: stage V sporulation protein D [Bellilinea sp.]